MSTIRVGKEIFNILSESLYGKVQYLFREYVQNSIDSISLSKDSNSHRIELVL